MRVPIIVLSFAIAMMLSACKSVPVKSTVTQDHSKTEKAESDATSEPDVENIAMKLNYHIEMGLFHNCVVNAKGELFCWADNEYGQLGDGTTNDQEKPLRIGTDSDWAFVAGGSGHTCAIKRNGALYCWGGYVGNYLLYDYEEIKRKWLQDDWGSHPVRVGNDMDWEMVSSGAWHVCGIKGNGELYCWGTNTMGQVGDGTKVDKHAPVRVGTDSDWNLVAVSFFHTCAIKMNGDLYCWGENKDGKLGDGTKENRLLPVRIGADHTWEKVSRSGSHTCAIDAKGELFCWGDNTFGQVGDGTNENRSVPTRIGSDSDWEEVAGGSLHTCAINKSGELYCWGYNNGGQLGDGTLNNRNIPFKIGQDADWTTISAASDYTCAVKIDGRLFCWGVDTCGQFCTKGIGELYGKQLVPLFIMNLNP
jgi:alpha-tubulin suppressor-like RCC1 family protein